MKRIACFLLAIAFYAAVAFPPSASPVSSPQAGEALKRAKSYLLKLEKERGVLSPWSYIALAASGENLGGSRVSRACELLGSDEELASGEMNTYCLLVFTLLAAGQDPFNYRGKNIVEIIQQAQLPSGKFADNVKTGGEDLVNSHIWAVLALKAAGASVPDPEGARRWLAGRQHEDGSFYWNARDRKTADVDTTGMVLMALGALGETQESPVVQKAVRYLQSVQKASGGFESWGAENPESCSMVILGLRTVGIDPQDPAFRKPEGDPVTALLRFQLPDGSFEHIEGGGVNEMATHQALMALDALLSGEIFWTRLKRKAGLGGREELSVRFWVGKKWYVTSRSGQEERHEMDAVPFVESGRTFVPVRYLALAMGVAERDILWDGKNRTVTLRLGNTAVRLTVGSRTLYVNGRSRGMDVAPVVRNGRTYLPARYVAEAFGYRVDWNESLKEVLITLQ